MAQARQAFEGDLIAYLISWIPRAVLLSWAGKPDAIDPKKINPWKPYEKPKALIELEEWRRKRKIELQIAEAKKRNAGRN